MDIEKQETGYSVASNRFVSPVLLLFLPLLTTPAPNLLQNTFFF